MKVNRCEDCPQYQSNESGVFSACGGCVYDFKTCPLPDWPRVSKEGLYKFLSETMMINCSSGNMIDAIDFIRSLGVEVADGPPDLKAASSFRVDDGPDWPRVSRQDIIEILELTAEVEKDKVWGIDTDLGTEDEMVAAVAKKLRSRGVEVVEEPLDHEDDPGRRLAQDGYQRKEEEK